MVQWLFDWYQVRDDILVPYVRLFRYEVDPDFILIYDDAHPYRINLIDEFLEREDIRLINGLLSFQT